VNTEITDKKKFEGWVLYDADCRDCVRWVRRFHSALTRRRFELLPLQTPWVRARLGLTDSKLLTEMRLLEPDGTVFGGADAVREIARHFWWTWPFRQLSRIPAAMSFFRVSYRWVARHRYCIGGKCEISSPVLDKRNHRSGKRTVFFEMP
jgi:predicted DCC family thiol-disulfide oxidoreductase YuxK